MQDLIKEALKEFSIAINETPDLQEYMKDKVRRVQINLLENEMVQHIYSITVEGSKVHPMEEKAFEVRPDISITSTEEDLTSILKKELSPIKAYATGRLKIRAPLLDMLLLRKMLSG